MIFVVFLVMFDEFFHTLGSRVAYQPNGSFTQETFTDVIRHIIENTTPGKKLLILDGHSSHHSVEALDL
jgi:hypothetical protein